MQMGSPSENAVTQHDIAAFHIEFPTTADLCALSLSFCKHLLKCSSDGTTIRAAMHLYDLFGQPEIRY